MCIKLESIPTYGWFDNAGITFLTPWTFESSDTQTAISFVSKTALTSRIVIARVINTSTLRPKEEIATILISNVEILI